MEFGSVVLFFDRGLGGVITTLYGAHNVVVSVASAPRFC